MMTANEPSEPASPSSPRGKLVTPLRVILFLFGLALIVAAVWAVITQRETFTQAWASVRHANPWLLAAFVLLPSLNWVCTAGTIWSFAGRYGRVPFREMLILIGSAWLLNLFPLRLGMLGRVAFHSKFHGIRVRDSAKVLLQTLGCSILALALLGLGAMLWSSLDRTDSPTDSSSSPKSVGLLVVFQLVPIVVLGAVALGLRRKDSEGAPSHLWRWPAAIAFRFADMSVWMLRYSMAFMLIARPLPVTSIAAVTASSQLAMLTPVQFGLREWTVGASWALLHKQSPDAAAVSAPGSVPEPPPASPDPDPQAEPEHPTSRRGELLNAAAPGLIADVVMRATELVFILPLGLASSLWVWRRLQKAKTESTAATDSNTAQ